MLDLFNETSQYKIPDICDYTIFMDLLSGFDLFDETSQYKIRDICDIREA